MSGLTALVDAGFRALGRTLSAVERVNLAALVAIETARGSAIKNGNVGNISASASYPGPVWLPPWFEPGQTDPKLAALHESMLAGKAPSAFRAYDSPEHGARDFARLLLTEPFASVMRAAGQTSADVLRRALSERYSHDYRNPAATATLEALQRQLGLAPGSGVAGGALLVLAALWFLRRIGRTNTRA